MDSRTHHWVGVDWEDVPEGYEAFVYLITNKINNKKYIGRKYFYNIKNSKKKGSRIRYKTVRESDWKEYKSSCKKLLKDIKEKGEDNFTFEILSLHRTRGEANYEEVKQQVSRDVLNSKSPNGEREYYNGNIMSKYFEPTQEGSPEYKQKCEKISKSSKKTFKEGRIHPMKGKVHPNKGKKMPQTGHNKCKGMINYTDGESNIRLHPHETPPEGFYKGRFVKNCPNAKRSERLRREYEESPKTCDVCSNPIPYDKRYANSCSKECGFKLVVINRETNGGKKNPAWSGYYNTPLGKFETAKEACEVHGCSDVTVRNRCNSTKPEWSEWYKSKEE